MIRTFQSFIVRSSRTSEGLCLLICETCKISWVNRLYPDELLKWCLEHRCGHKILSTAQYITVEIPK
jgi:hypothetical protein